MTFVVICNHLVSAAERESVKRDRGCARMLTIADDITTTVKWPLGSVRVLKHIRMSTEQSYIAVAKTSTAINAHCKEK